MKKAKEKNIILFIGTINKATINGFSSISKHIGKKCTFAVLTDSTKPLKKESRELFNIVLECDTHNPTEIIQTLAPYQENIIAVTSRSETNIPLFQRVIPFLPYHRTPTIESLEWASNKILMRRRFRAYNPKITPKYRVVKNTDPKELDSIEKNIGFPLVVKPTGLATSMLVHIAYHKEELEKVLKTVFRKLEKTYRDNHGRGTPTVIVEEFMEGEMYSVDAYVNARGKAYFCPMVYVKTGKMAGYDDFFAYLTISPTKLKSDSVKKAHIAALDGIHALGLRNTTAHVELMRTEDGWKIIEIGPRIGGFRHDMHYLSHDIDHSANDILIRIPKTPVIPKVRKGYSAVMKIFSKKEGVITSIRGLKKIEQLASFVKHTKNKPLVGTKAIYAKNGGSSLFNIYLFNKDRSSLLADIRRIEKELQIDTK